MAQITSSSRLVTGLESLNAKPTLEQVGRAPPRALSPQEETENLSGLNVAYKLLFADKADQQLALGNANRGLSFTQTADSALNKTISAVNELRALAVRASSESIDEDERESLQEDAQELIEKVNEIAETTLFAGKKIFDGSLDNIVFETAGTEDQLIKLVALKADAIGLGLQPGSLQSVGERAQLAEAQTGNQGIQEGDVAFGNIDDFKLKPEGTSLSEQINIADPVYGGRIKRIANTESLTTSGSDNYGGGLAKAIAERINDIREQGVAAFKSVAADAETTFKGADLAADDYAGGVNDAAATTVAQAVIGDGDLTINGARVGAVAFLENDSAGTLANRINELTDKTGVDAQVNEVGELVLSAADGRDIVVNTASAEVSNQLFGGGSDRFDERFTDLRIAGRVSVYSEEPVRFLGTDAKTLGFSSVSDTQAQFNQATDNNLAGVDLSSSGSAVEAIDTVDRALQQIRTFQVGLKNANQAFQAGLESVAINISRQDAASVINRLASNISPDNAVSALAAQANIDGSTALYILRSK